MKIQKNKIGLGVALATITMTGALVSQPVLAHKNAKPHAHQVSAERLAEAANNKAEVLEAQLRALQDEVASLRAQVGTTAPVAAADTQKVQELDAWMASVKSQPVKAKNRDENLIFFRGGYARNDVKRHDILTGDLSPVSDQGKTNQDGYYIGAGFDFGLTDNVWGLADKTDVMAELMFDYRSFGERNLAVTPLTAAAFGVADSSKGTVAVSQFTLGASPKVKFMKGSAFRPWIIPLGLTVNVISPPSNGVTVLNPGMQFGTGAEYAIWKAIKIGADVRYNLTGRAVDGVNTNGLTAGGYLGIGF